MEAVAVESNRQPATTGRRKANLRLAVVLALVAVAFYVAMIVSTVNG